MDDNLNEALFFNKKKDLEKKKDTEQKKRVKKDLDKKINEAIRKKNEKKLDKSHVTHLIHAIYRIPPQYIADETPNFFRVVRFIMVVGIPFYIHPLLGVITWFTNKIIEEKVNERYEKIVLGTYKRELESVEKSLETEKDEDKKEMLEQTKNRLEDSIPKLERYFFSIRKYKDKKDEIDKNFSNVSNRNDDDFDMDFDFNESGGLNKMIYSDEEVTKKVLQKFNEEINQLIDIYIESEYLLSEGKLGNIIKRTAAKTERINRRASDKVDDVGDAVIDGGRSRERKKMQQEIVDGRLKISTLIKRALAMGTAIAINPVIGALGSIVFLARKGIIKKKEENELLFEMKKELEIVEEKIKDAEASNDRKKKYQYIRLRKELQRSIERLRYGRTLKQV